MAKRRSKIKSGSSLKSLTIKIVIGTIGVILLVIIGAKLGIFSGLFNLLFSIILVAAVVVNLILAYKLFKRLEEIVDYSQKVEAAPKQNKFEIQKDSSSSDIIHLKEQNRRLEERCKILQEIKETLTEKEANLKEELYQLKAKEQQKSQIATPVQTEATTPKALEAVPAKPTPPKNNSLFFDGPYDDRLFSDTNAASEKRHRYVYRIEYATAEPSIGKLHLEPTADEYDILRSYSDTVLKPACAFDNAFYTSFHNISQLAPGAVQKQGNDWYVKEKVKIRFN